MITLHTHTHTHTTNFWKICQFKKKYIEKNVKNGKNQY